jgi:RNA-splicing ligase RtcB
LAVQDVYGLPIGGVLATDQAVIRCAVGVDIAWRMKMSRTQAKNQFTWDDVRRVLSERGVTLISAGLDEAPMAYKDIDEVMAAQHDLVTVLAKFQPRLVKMAPAGERPED